MRQLLLPGKVLHIPGCSIGEAGSALAAWPCGDKGHEGSCEAGQMVSAHPRDTSTVSTTKKKGIYFLVVMQEQWGRLKQPCYPPNAVTRETLHSRAKLRFGFQWVHLESHI